MIKTSCVCDNDMCSKENIGEFPTFMFRVRTKTDMGWKDKIVHACSHKCAVVLFRIFLLLLIMFLMGRFFYASLK